MKKLIGVFLGLGLLFAGLSTPVAAQTVDVFDQCHDGVAVEDSAVCNSAPGEDGEGGNSFVSMSKTLVNSLLIALGMVAVVMIVVGGFRYVLSRGEAGEVKVAKDIIVYSAVGLIVAIISYAIVNFVLGWF